MTTKFNHLEKHLVTICTHSVYFHHCETLETNTPRLPLYHCHWGLVEVSL